MQDFKELFKRENDFDDASKTWKKVFYYLKNYF